MAQIFYPGGDQILVKPNDGKKFSIEELNKLVHGHFDAVRIPYVTEENDTVHTGWLIVNDNGKLINLPYNPSATSLIQSVGYNDYIVGVAVLCFEGEID